MPLSAELQQLSHKDTDTHQEGTEESAVYRSWDDLYGAAERNVCSPCWHISHAKCAPYFKRKGWALFNYFVTCLTYLK
jgi:hypothetical protein